MRKFVIQQGSVNQSDTGWSQKLFLLREY